jgi:hypothetical protein
VPRQKPLRAIGGPMKMEAAMTYSSWQHGHVALTNQAGERLARNAKLCDRIVAVLTNPDLVAIVTICNRTAPHVRAVPLGSKLS